MDITPQFTRADILQQVLKSVIKLDNYVLNELQFIGLEFVRKARIEASFTDRTGNLRSSIGYIILRNGEIIEEDFEASQEGTDKGTGRSQGLEYAVSLGKSNLGYVLIVVAGMSYAAAVEAKGYDVLTLSSMEAEQSLKNAIAQVNKVFK